MKAGKKRGRAVLACALSTALVFQVPTVAIASTKEELQMQMETARETIANLNAQAEVCEYDLITVRLELEKTVAHINELDGQIPQTLAQLEEAQSELAEVVSASYKTGTPTLLDVLLGSTSFEDMISRVVYANKVSEHERAVIQSVKDLNTQLEQQKSDLLMEKDNEERLVTEKEQRLATVQEATAAANSYYNQLSDEIREMIRVEEEAERRATEAAAQQAAAEAQLRAEADQAAAQEQQSQQQQQSQEQQSQGGNDEETTQQEGDNDGNDDNTGEEHESEQPQQTPEPDPEPEPTPDPDPEPVVPILDDPGDLNDGTTGGSSGGSSTYVQTPAAAANASAMVARAFSILGAAHSMSGYYWSGNIYTSYFTCSGVVDFARGLPSWSSSPESLWAEVGSRMVYSTSQLNYGDLVFYPYAGRYPGHVGIYIGGGQIIDSIPNGGVAIRDVNYMTFIGGGPIY